ncbi:hypothetical protein AAFF_G00290190 [Aldrovandia affinis]|uniref:Uncharacterized protein n=1 Tax=Aldrovandia affinis TaxID=143900 RepID=A0AAD7RC42_9TELE|nr:hypothetical protein AAFF_G00290190 [Aldrovandia affinis]
MEHLKPLNSLANYIGVAESSDPMHYLCQLCGMDNFHKDRGEVNWCDSPVLIHHAVTSVLRSGATSDTHSRCAIGP